jgi:hypothetical protein
VAPRAPRHSAKSLLDLHHAIGNQAVQRMLRMSDFLPQTAGSAASQAAVHAASPVADGVNAMTLGRAVHLSSAFPQLEPAEQQRVLAHEAVHLEQHSSPGPAASREMLEREANVLSSHVLSGQAPHPQLHADPATPLADEDGGPLPGDRLAVERAQARLKVLERVKERQDILGRRERLDNSMKKRLGQIEAEFKQKGPSVQDYRDQEQANLLLRNEKPVTLEITPTAIRIHARFQVRFEGLKDEAARAKYAVLERNFQKGVRDTWNQKLSSAVMGGRTLEMLPELHFVSSTAQRDPNFWLITVRPKDDSPMDYEGTSLGVAPGGVPTAATDSTLDGGVMSLPPIIVDQPNILGHETLHLFGMVDRYAIIPAAKSPTHQQEDLPLRDTQDRKDPLGEAEGQILEEDVGFVLYALGAYPTGTESEISKEIDTLKEIIRKGRDPNSLIRKRKDFTREMVKQTDDLD